jgi:hypothetical protein
MTLARADDTEWYELHQDDLRDKWERARARRPLQKRAALK